MPESPQRILVVDDEPSVRDLAGPALISLGFDCDVAADGEEAAHSLAARQYDGVVTDLRMPGIHGHALCELLLRSHKPPQIMVLSGLADARLARDLLNRGVYEFVQKPIDFDVLAAKVRRMVERSREQPGEDEGAESKKRAQEAAQKAADLVFNIETSLVDLTKSFGERLDRAFELTEDLPDPPRAVVDVIRRLEEEEGGVAGETPAIDGERHWSRKVERAACFTTATAVPVSADWNPKGEPFKIALRDLSEGGCRLLHTRATNEKYLALSWNTTQVVAEEIRVVVQVRRCHPCGRFYDYGGQFLILD